MEDIEKLRAEVEALKIIVTPLLWSIAEPARNGVQKNIASAMRRYKDRQLSLPEYSDEQIEWIETNVKALALNPGS